MSEEFKAKLASLQFSVATKNPGSRRNYYDRQAIDESFGDAEQRIDRTLEETGGVGTLRWSRGRPYRRNRTDGTWEAASDKDTETILGPGP